ncbi:hypothetical protein GCM10009682_59580 [Luedemannella flava]|uniref:Anti-sigma factor antagonist n=1 Tax=Luedemannella flava TaxID=349316 RepID=A0ABP4Z1Y7_9ACTN
MVQFEARTSTKAGRVVVALAGECDLAARDQLVAALREALDAGSTVTVDLSGLSFLDSSGIHELVSAHRTATRNGGALHVTGASGVVAQVLDLTGVAGLLRP